MKPTSSPLLLLTGLALFACTDHAADTDFDTRAELGLRALATDEVVGAIEVGQTRLVQHTGAPRYRALSFDGRQGDELDIWVRSTSADAVMWLTDSAFRTIAHNDDANGTAAEDDATTTDANLRYKVPTTGRYYVVFRDKVGRAGTFDVRVTPTNAQRVCGLLQTVCATGCCDVDTYVVKPADGLSRTYPSIQADTAGNLYIAYTTVSSGLWTSGLAKYTAATNTWTDKRIWDSGGYHPVVRVDHDGGVHLALSSDNPRVAIYMHSSNGGATFSPSTLPGQLVIGGECDMAVDAQNNPHFVCGSEGAWNEKSPMYATRRGNAWSVEFLGRSLFPQNGMAGRIAIWNAPDGTAQPRILGPAGEFAAWNGNRWIAEAVPTGAPPFSGHAERDTLTLAVNQRDEAQALFFRVRDRAVYTANRTSQGWVTTPTGVQIAADTLWSNAPSLVGATDASGRFTAAFGTGLLTLTQRAGTWTQTPWQGNARRYPSVVDTTRGRLVAYSGVGAGVGGAIVLARAPR